MRNEKNRNQNTSENTANTSSAERATKSGSAATHQKNQTPDTVEVLYQKLGDRWFAFSLVGDEVYFGSVSPEEVHAEENQKPVARKGRGIDRTGTA